MIKRTKALSNEQIKLDDEQKKCPTRMTYCSFQPLLNIHLKRKDNFAIQQLTNIQIFFILRFILKLIITTE